MDHITPTRVWDREFRVDTTSMAKGTASYGLPRLADPGVMVFTDGSQAKKQGYTGAGIVLTRDNAFMRDQEGTTLAFSFNSGVQLCVSVRDVGCHESCPDGG